MSATSPSMPGFMDRLSTLFRRPVPAPLPIRTEVEKRLQNAVVEVFIKPDPRPSSEILKELEDTLAVFNDQFLTRNLRHEIGLVLMNESPHKRVMDIFYEQNFDLVGPHRLNKFSAVVHKEGREQFQLDIKSYIDAVNAKIGDLEAQEAALRNRFTESRANLAAVRRINAKIVVLKWPIPMMEALLAESKNPAPALFILQDVAEE